MDPRTLTTLSFALRDALRVAAITVTILEVALVIVDKLEEIRR